MTASLPTIEDHQMVLDRLDALAESVASVAEALTSLTGPPPLMLTTPQAVAFCGLPVETLRKLRVSGALGYHDVEGSKRYSRDELAALVASLTAPPDHLRVVAS